MKNRKSIIALLLVAIIGIVGLTVAYFSNSTSITNEFETSEYGTDVTETFTSPTGWQPGDETPKVLTVKNTGEVDEAVRVKVEEKWVNKNGQELPLTQDGNVAALIHYINDSDWTRVDVANEDYYYYYYNYKLAPDEETSELLDKVTFNPLINASTTCTTSTENGVTTRSCKSNGSGYDGATYTLKFTIETVQYNKYADAWNTNVAILEEKPAPVVQQTGAEYLATNATNAANAEYNATTKGKMFTFTHGTGENAVNETRYIGNEPNNYVYFNCDEPQEGVEYNYASSCEKWRIIGVFDVDDGTGNVEQRMKLVRGEIIKKDYWNTASNGNGYNDWTADNATLKLFLNGDYYNRTGEAATYGLKASARSMIGNAVYYLGSVSYDSNNEYGTTEKIYGEERGNTVCGACNSDTTKLTWTGKVGLMYPSDEYMVYGNGVNTTCYSNPNGCSGTNAQTGWVYKSNNLEGQSSPSYIWLLSPIAGYSINALFAISDGSLVDNVVNNGSSGVRPVVYLKSNIKIADGTGEVGSPYVLEAIQ